MLKVDDDEDTPIETFSGTKTYITLKNHHTLGCPVYVLGKRLQENIAALPNLKPCSGAEIYLDNSPFHSELLALVPNPASAQSGALKNIDIENTCLTPDLQGYHIKYPQNEPSITPKNRNQPLYKL